jgi:hypothetical protein
MSNAKEIKGQIQTLVAQITEKEKELEKLFDVELKNLFEATTNSVEGYTINKVHIYINNHNFNDGEATYFSFAHEDLTLCATEIETGKEVEIEGYGSDKSPNELKKIRKQFLDFFANFDAGDFYENKYSDSFEGIDYVFENGKLEIN